MSVRDDPRPIGACPWFGRRRFRARVWLLGNRRRARSEAGQAVPLVLAVIALGVVVLLALVPLAEAAGERSRARTAADAAALAGAAEGEAAAREVAQANGAELVLWRAAGPDVWVEVTLGEARAEAKATRDD